MYVCCKYIVCILCNNTENVTPPLNDVFYKGLNALIHISLKKKESFLDSCLVELKNSVTNSVMTVKEGLKGKNESHGIPTRKKLMWRETLAFWPIREIFRLRGHKLSWMTSFKNFRGH